MPNYRHMRRLDKLKAMFERVGARPRTQLGQNFLLDKNQVNYIARTGDPQPEDVILEVGPGTGFLTTELAPYGPTVLCVEMDKKMLQIARHATAEFPNVLFMEGDILAGKSSINPDVLEKLKELLEHKGKDACLKSVANLPYSAGTPFMANLFSNELPWSRCVFLLQLEVGQRLVAQPGTSAYGALSIISALGAKRAKIERKVPPQVFWPRPKVTSAVVSIEYKSVEERMAIPWKALRRVTSTMFSSRRKTLRNAAKGLVAKEKVVEFIEAAGLDPNMRAQEIAPENFLQLAETFKSFEE